MKIRLTTIIKMIFFISILLNSPVSLSLDLHMDFENGTPGSKAASSSCSLNNGPVFTDLAGRTVFTKDEAYGLGQSAELNITEGSHGFGDFGGLVKFSTCGGRALGKGDEIWISLRVKFPLNYLIWTSDGILKFLRLSTRRSATCTENCNGGYNDFLIYNRNWPQLYRYTKEGSLDRYQSGMTVIRAADVGESARIVLGQWTTFEWYLKFDSVAFDDGGMAIVRIWKDGKLLTETTNLHNINTDEDTVTALYLHTWWNKLAPRTQKSYIDDLKIVTTPHIPAEIDANSNVFIGTGNTVGPNPPNIVVSSEPQ